MRSLKSPAILSQKNGVITYECYVCELVVLDQALDLGELHLKVAGPHVRNSLLFSFTLIALYLHLAVFLLRARHHSMVRIF